MSYHRVESEDERVRDKETIRKLKKAMVDQQEERVRDKETICKLKKAMVHQQEAMTHQPGYDYIRLLESTKKYFTNLTTFYM